MSLIKNRAFISQLNYNQNKKNVIIIIELQKKGQYNQISFDSNNALT